MYIVNIISKHSGEILQIDMANYKTLDEANRVVHMVWDEFNEDEPLKCNAEMRHENGRAIIELQPTCKEEDTSFLGTALFCAYVAIVEDHKEDTVIENGNNDAVNHPSHYTSGGIECIDAMLSAYGRDVVMGFCLGNAFKYQFRCLHKNNEIQDLDKAKWYIDKYKELKGSE